MVREDQTRNLEFPDVQLHIEVRVFDAPGTLQSYRNKKAPAKPGPSIWKNAPKSARIKFADQMRLHLHGERHFREPRNAGHLRNLLAMIDFEVSRHVALGELVGFENDNKLLRG